MNKPLTETLKDPLLLAMENDGIIAIDKTEQEKIDHAITQTTKGYLC